MLPTFQAKSVNETDIVLKNKEDMQNLYKDISEDKDIVIEWLDDMGMTKNQIYVGKRLLRQIKLGKIKLSC